MDTYIKELEDNLKHAVARLKEDLRGMRSGRPSVEAVENIKVNYFDSWMEIKQLGSIGLMPPREIRISLWDKGAVPATMQAIEAAQLGFSLSNDGNVVRALLSPLSSERREELSKLVRKTAENFRIEVRSIREDIMKKLKTAEESGEITEDMAFSAKDKVQKKVNEANAEIEKITEEKISELGE